MGAYLDDGILVADKVRWFGDVVSTEGIRIGSTSAEVEAVHPDARVEAEYF